MIVHIGTVAIENHGRCTTSKRCTHTIHRNVLGIHTHVSTGALHKVYTLPHLMNPATHPSVRMRVYMSDTLVCMRSCMRPTHNYRAQQVALGFTCTALPAVPHTHIPSPHPVAQPWQDATPRQPATETLALHINRRHAPTKQEHTRSGCAGHPTVLPPSPRAAS